MGESNSVLLVEDDPGYGGLVRAWLEDTSPGRFRVEHVDRIEQARVRTADERYDAAIVDLGLPDSQGAETVARFRLDRPACPLVVLTGDDDEKLVVEVMERGADELIWKGDANPARLAAAVDRAMARHRRRARQEALATDLRDQVTVLHRALDGHPDAAIVFDDNNKVQFANRAAHALLELRTGDDVPPELLQGPRAGWSGRLEVGPPGQRIPITVLRRPLVAVDTGERKGVLLARIEDPDLPALRLAMDDAHLAGGTADALVERATDLLRRAGTLAASTEDISTMPTTLHMLALELIRLALGLKETVEAATLRLPSDD